MNDDTTPPAARTWSLERRLPLLISALLALAVGAIGAVAYRETRLAALQRAGDRLESSARELARTSSASTAPRTATLLQLAASPDVRQAVRGEGLDSVLLRTRLDASLQAADSTFVGWQVLGIANERRVATGEAADARANAILGEAVGEVARTDSVRRSRFFVSGGQRVDFWTVVPVHEQGRIAGFLAERRRLADNPRAAAVIRGLVGEDVELAFTNVASDEWISLRGRPIPPLVRFVEGAPFDSASLAEGATGPAYAVRSRLGGTPWGLVLAQPAESVLRRPREFLRRLLLAGAIVLVVGAAAAWLLSRHVTRPLSAITRAAEAIAAGDYGGRVRGEGRGGAELVRLATTFDTMAAHVERSRAELEERNTALERANAAKSQFLAMMSHELRTPLNAIGGYAELVALGLRGPVTPAQVDDLQRIRRNKDHLLAIINDLLSFARADAGRISLTLVAVPLREALAAVRETVDPQYEEKGIALVVDAPPDVRLLADRDRVHQILLNLLTNALRFTEPGGRVSIASQVVGEEVRIEVTDTGIGIPADRLESIFEPFVQVDDGLTRKVGGTGLGLAIARDLAKAMGGTLSARSVEGSGSTFSVVLPRFLGKSERKEPNADERG